MKTFAIRRRSNWKDSAELGIVAGVSARVGNEEMPDRVRWIRSYVVREADGRLGTVCIYQATDEAAILEHARRARDIARYRRRHVAPANIGGDAGGVDRKTKTHPRHRIRPVGTGRR